MAETKTTAKKAPAKKATAKKAAGLVKMVHEDGRKADVHPSMVEAYRSGGYREA